MDTENCGKIWNVAEKKMSLEFSEEFIAQLGEQGSHPITQAKQCQPHAFTFGTPVQKRCTRWLTDSARNIIFHLQQTLPQGKHHIKGTKRSRAKRQYRRDDLPVMQVPMAHNAIDLAMYFPIVHFSCIF